MAEVVGIIASVITIVNLAKPTAKFVEALYKIAKDDGAMEQEILSVAEHIESAYETIELARLRLRDNCDRIQAMRYPTSRVAKYIERGNLKDSIRKLTEYFERQLAKAEKSLINSRSSNFRFVNGMKWYLWTNMEMTTIFTTLDRVVMYLSIMGPILELEITTYLMDRAEGEIAQLLKVQINSLRDQLEQTERAFKKYVRSKQLQKNHGDDFIAEFENSATLLVGLSESMRRTGTVPSDRRPRKHRERRRRRRHTSDQSFSSNGDSSSTSTSQQISTATDGSPVQTTPVFTFRVSHTNQEPPASRPPPLLRSHQTPQPPLMTAPEVTQLRTSDRNIDMGLWIGAGWIKDPGEPDAPLQKIESIMDSRVFGNYISFTRANELRLHIKDLEPNDAHHPSQSTETNNRVGQVIGKVSSIEWRQKRNSKPFMVDFWVTELHPSRMNEHPIFGAEFVKRL